LTDTEAFGMNADQRKKNVRLAWILATVAAVFFAGFLARMALLGR
jgi:hypothetical protein